MKAEVHFIRWHGIKMAECDAAGTRPLVGDLMLDEHWDSKTRAFPELTLTAPGVRNGVGLIAIFYGPRILMLGNYWMRFTGYELIRFGEDKQLVVQD